jgi:hypothetical protein
VPVQPGDLSEFYTRFGEGSGPPQQVAAGAFELELTALLEEANQDGIDKEFEEEDCAYVCICHLCHLIHNSFSCIVVVIQKRSIQDIH